MARDIRSDDTALQLAPVSGRSRMWLFALCVFLPLAITLIALVVATQGIGAPAGVRPDLIGGTWPLTFASSLGMIAMVVVPVWLMLDRLMKRREVVMENGTLGVRSTFYRTHMPLSELDMDRARVVDLDEHVELRPGMKVNSFALPGFRSGWFFRLHDRRRTFVAIADGRWKLWLPTRGDHDLLLEPRDPQRFLDRLHELASPTR